MHSIIFFDKYLYISTACRRQDKRINMSTVPNEVPVQEVSKNESIETNLAKQRQMYERKLEQERMARAQAEERAVLAEKAATERAKLSPLNDDEDDDEPYVDKKKLHKTLTRFGEQTKQQTQEDIKKAVEQALDQERRGQYLRDNSDFNQVMNEQTIERFALKHPKLAQNILQMPDGFERQKLVYENIKALGIDKPESKSPTIQEKIESNRRSPYYQPSGVGTAPYATTTQGDFSSQGQKNAYDKMQELKNRLRI